MLCAQCTVRRTAKCAHCAAHRNVRRTWLVIASLRAQSGGINKLICTGGRRNQIIADDMLQGVQAVLGTSGSLIIKILSLMAKNNIILFHQQGMVLLYGTHSD